MDHDWRDAAQFAPARANIRFTFHAMVTRFHSPCTLSVRQQELAEPELRLDDPEHRFGSLFTQRVELLALFRLEPMAHCLNRRGVYRRRRIVCETFSQRRMMRFTPHRDHRLDPRVGTGVHVALAEIPVVGKQRANLAQFAGQCGQLAQHRLKLLFAEFGACTTSAATTSRLSAATAAWAL